MEAEATEHEDFGVDEAVEAADVGDLHGTVPIGGQGGRHGLGCLRHAGWRRVSEEEGSVCSMLCEWNPPRSS
ncbi:hypothetical protein DKP78_17750, partial [Enterococcus faecium]